ncbi:conserved hypothetical protein [Leishmania infantum JPCM5]|uniref:Uncharacterized protein n=2 Tax=Leishmania infantum TaxID=5671 RepID=A4HSV8_LEIIN|nr:conserved hypothetical protein [Leishmania infantum JPCM5]CAC9446131.1 hypothetical_protein_-_conserved [Leishmania infantum]CAM65500.2 conserved hypothetical protein [Leishmania infantum JPCM5]SUZ39114.1 hypothetical_protein_-_conserved [Leishmania infantum]|eukprot:XP_001463149.2 conserved hypothetical protein [Leishmania infantum JPCM5]
MGGVCSRATAKRAHHDRGSAAGKDANQNHASLPKSPAANAAPGGSSGTYVRVTDRNGGAGNPEAGVPERPLSGSALVLPTSVDARSSNASSDFTRNIGLLSAKAPLRDMETKTSSVATAISSAGGNLAPLMNNGGACPSSAQAGPLYDTYFPPGHDAGMRLGTDKYTGVGASPLSAVNSPDLQSFASTVSCGKESKPRDQVAHSGIARPHANPMIFTDDDTSVMETASSAFATPRELRKSSSSIAGFPRSASIISRGSMMSQQPHGYSYYNSSATCAEHRPMPPSSSLPLSAAPTSLTPAAPKGSQRQQLQQKPQPVSPGQHSNTTLTNVRANRQVLATRSFGGGSTPLTRQGSIVGSDCFQSCCSYTDVISSAAGHLTPATPAGAAAEADVRLLSGGYPASTAGGASSMGRQLYTCRSAYTPSTHARSLSSPAAATTGSAHPLAVTHSQGGTVLSSVQDASLLPPRSPLQTPRSAAGPCSTPNAQQLYLRRQASLCSGIEDAPASEDFFSVPPSARNFFLERSSAAASTPANHFALGRGFTDTAAAAAANASHQSTTTTLTGSGSAARKSRRVEKCNVASPESRYSRSFDDAAALSSLKPFSESFNSGSAPSSWTDASPLTRRALPEEQQLSHTPAATGKKAASHGKNNSGGSRKGRRLRKRPHARSDFLLDLNPPPQAALEMAAAATGKANPSPSSTSAADAMAMPPLPSVASNTVALVDNHGTEAAFVSSSTASKTSTRKPDAADGHVAARGVRLTQAYVETLPLASDAAAAGGGGGNTAVLPTSPSGSMSSFSTVASSYRRDVRVRASSRGSSEVPQQSQRPESDTAPCRRRHSSRGAGGDSSKLRSKEASAAFSDSAEHGGMESHTPAAKATRGAGAAAGAEATSASSVVPLTTNPKPWVPSGRSAAANAVRSDPRSTAATTTGPPGDTSRRSSLARRSSTPKKSIGARPASATMAATARRSPGGAAKPGSGKGAPRRTSASGSLVPPSPTGARKPTAKRTAAAADREPSDAEKSESVVEYAIGIGDTEESEGPGMDVVHIDGGSRDNGLQTALEAASPQQPSPQQHADRTEDAVKFNDAKDGFPEPERVPQPCDSNADDADEPRLAGFRASPDVSNATVITSLADSACLQLYTEAQLVTIFGGSAARLHGCDSDDKHLWASDEGRGGGGAAKDGDDSEDDRAALPADLEMVVEHRAVFSTDGDGLGPSSVSATSAEEVMLAATPSSAARSNAESPTAKYRDAPTLTKEDTVPPALAVSNGGNKCEEAMDYSPVEISSRSFSSGSDSHASEMQVTTLH